MSKIAKSSCLFFQAEDGIRDLTVTGVQTCALPISWYKKPWWKELLKEVRAAKQDELDALLTGIIMEASNQLADRVKYGNSVVTDAGEVVKVPLKATELATAGIGIPYDKRALIRWDATVKVELQGSVDAILERLKNTFESLAKTILINEKEVITNE